MIYCDHCGKELPRSKYFDTTIDFSSHRQINTDLCDDCFDELYDAIAVFTGKKEKVVEVK